MADDDTTTLEITIEHPPGYSTEESVEVPSDLSRSEAEEWAKDIFWEHCNFTFNTEDFEEADDE